MNLNPRKVMNPGTAYAIMGKALQKVLPFTHFLLSSRARNRPPK